MVVVWQHDTGRAQPPTDGGYGGTESYIRARAFAPSGSAGITQTLSITDDITAGPAVAVDGKGGAVAVWTQAYDGHRFTIIASPRAPAGRFGPRQALGRTNRFLGGSPHVAMNTGGEAVVMWARSDRVELAPRRSGGHFGTPQEITARRPVPGAVVVGTDGAALATWTERGSVYASRRAPGHRFGKPTPAEPRRPGRRGRHGRDRGGRDRRRRLAGRRFGLRRGRRARPGRRHGAASGDLRALRGPRRPRGSRHPCRRGAGRVAARGARRGGVPDRGGARLPAAGRLVRRSCVCSRPQARARAPRRSRASAAAR